MLNQSGADFRYSLFGVFQCQTTFTTVTLLATFHATARRLSEKRLMTKVRFKLQTTFKDGHVICHDSVKQTLMDTVSYVGAEKVRELGIMKNGCKLVSIDESDVADRWKKEVTRVVLPNGMHLFCHMSTDAKAKLLQEISDRLGNPFVIEYVESND